MYAANKTVTCILPYPINYNIIKMCALKQYPVHCCKISNINVIYYVQLTNLVNHNYYLLVQIDVTQNGYSQGTNQTKE